MFEVKPEDAVKEYNDLKVFAVSAYNNKNYENVYDLVRCASTLAYQLNFRYADDELELLLNKVAKETLSVTQFSPIKGRYVFYDYFGIDNRGLTQQYLHALKVWGVEFLYILESPGLSENSDIYKEIRSIEHAQIHVVPDGISQVEKTRNIVEVISNYRPERAFLHLAPWDVLAVSVWSMFGNVEKYFIDLTDHAFWLGKSCSDYFIGFRDYGFSIATDFRGIDSQRLLKQPYYPILNKSNFEGFPVSLEAKTIIFSGASYYKIYGENNAFLNILKRIVEDNPDAVVLFAGSGNDRPFRKFIKQNGLAGRIVLIGNRKDINEVFKRCDIYLNTYPVIGGLMSQYAVANGKPIIGYTTDDIPCNFSEGLFDQSLPNKSTFTDLDEFHREINLLVKDKAYRASRSKFSAGVLPTPESFSKGLLLCVEEKKAYNYKHIHVDAERFMRVYFSMENDYLHQYHAIKIKELQMLYFKIDLLGGLVSLINLMLFPKGKILKYISKKFSRRFGL